MTRFFNTVDTLQKIIKNSPSVVDPHDNNHIVYTCSEKHYKWLLEVFEKETQGNWKGLIGAIIETPNGTYTFPYKNPNFRHNMTEKEKRAHYSTLPKRFLIEFWKKDL